MPCIPLSSSAVSPPPFNIPGFAIPLPNFNFALPSIPMPDLSGLYKVLGMLLPPGLMKPSFEPDFLNDVFGAVMDLLNKFVPFLMLYKFFLPLLNLFLCILEVICSIPNPFKLARAISRLFRYCIPEFLALFPFLALILMILSLILLIIQLIEYLIARIIALIEQIIKNILLLAKAAQRLDNNSIIAIVKKIGDLICLLQNLFVIFGVILLIIQIIQAMLSLTFSVPPCDSNNGSADGCCTPDVCPSFIKDNGTMTGTNGNFLYYAGYGIDSGISLPAGFPPIVFTLRPESWLFYDPTLDLFHEFVNINHPWDLPASNTTVFFPQGTNYTNSSNPDQAPYTVSFRLLMDPDVFFTNFQPDGYFGPRYIRINNAIVQSAPTVGVLSSDGKSYDAPFNGTLSLIGGQVTEDDGTPIKNLQGNNITIDQFFHSITSGTQTPGMLFSNLSYTFTINYAALVGANLITLGCLPEVAANKDIVNTTISAQFNSNAAKLANLQLPDVATAQECITNAITTYRQKISLETTAVFQNTVLECLNNLNNQAVAAASQIIDAGFDPYKSSFTLIPTIQFTSGTIEVQVSLNESSGQSMTANLPLAAAEILAKKLSANVTFGEVSPFTYDGYQFFTARISSPTAGNGDIQVAYNNNFISTFTNPPTIDQPASVAITTEAYTFVLSQIGSAGGVEGQPTRDITDVANDGGGSG